MKSVMDWVFSQLVSNSLVSSRPVSGSDSFFERETRDEDFGTQAQPASLVPSLSSDASNAPNRNQKNLPSLTSQETPRMDSYQPPSRSHEKQKDPLEKIDNLQVKFIRILLRLGQSQENLLVAKVFYRMHLAVLIRAGESDLKRVNLRRDKAHALASEQEAIGSPGLDFTCRILVLGKTGVGKSATINSIFGEVKTNTDAFCPATSCIQEIVGTINGVKTTFIDTPGLLPSSTSHLRRNRKILLSIKRFIRKSPPDMVLYFERLDLINAGYSDYPLLKLVSEVFGKAIWFNTIIVMTHSSSINLEGPNGYPVNYDSYVSQCSDLVQHSIHQAVSDTALENPVLLVENHHQCKKNGKGERILPNGQAWKSQLLLLCICTKVLADVNSLLEFQNSIELGPVAGNRLPSLPHLLSSILQRRSVSKSIGTDNDIDDSLLSGLEEEDEYDQLPSIRILTKAQFERLTKSQKQEYLDELDYRETLYLKKQIKEEYRRRQDKYCKEKSSVVEQQESPEAVLLPDMAVPPSFDSDRPVHRYRCLVTTDQWLVRPVLDPQGWDHDVGFDGVNLETSMEIRKNIYATVMGQMSKDKQDFSIHSQCAAAYVDPHGHTHSIGIDLQSAGKDMICTVHTSTELRNLKHNVADCGVSLTSHGKKCYIGAKIQDAISVGKRLKFVMNAGRLEGSGQVAYGGSLEAMLRGKDYPARNDNVGLALTVLSFNKEMVLGGSLQSEFRLTRGLRASVNANINSRKMGQISVKASSSEHLQIALIAAYTISKFLLRGKSIENMNEIGKDDG